MRKKTQGLGVRGRRPARDDAFVLIELAALRTHTSPKRSEGRLTSPSQLARQPRSGDSRRVSLLGSRRATYRTCLTTRLADEQAVRGLESFRRWRSIIVLAPSGRTPVPLGLARREHYLPVLDSFYPVGITAFSPGLRACELPWVAVKRSRLPCKGWIHVV